MPRLNPGLPVLATLLAALALPRAAEACSCAGPHSPEEAFTTADAVFLGTVTEVDPALAGSPGFFSRARRWIRERLGQHGRGYEVTLAVDAAWKGVDATSIVMTTGGEMCDFYYQAGEQYVIYAYAYQGELSTSICT